MSFYLFLLVLLLINHTAAIRYSHNYYLGKYEKKDSMHILFRRSQRSETKSGRDEWLSETLTYPYNLGPYGGRVLAVHVGVTQSTSTVGRLTLTRGQIGGTHFEMIVEADHTMFLVCNYTVYGEKPFKRTKRVRFPQKLDVVRDEL